jgi:hypothetical protein
MFELSWGVQKIMITVFFISAMLLVNKALSKEGNSIKLFHVSVLPWLKKEKRRFTRKIPVPPSCSTWTILHATAVKKLQAN